MTHTPPARSGKHLVVGAGAIGTGIARLLAEAGYDVTLASRSGEGTAYDGVRRLALDATDADALARAADGAASLVNAVNPPSYTHWERDWPPMAGAFLAAAERSGAGLVTVGNLYGYGPTAEQPLTEATPLAATGPKGQVRAQMWRDALGLHTAGRLRATELRASDYFGPGARAQVSYANSYVMAPAVSGKTVRLVLGLPDVPHSWTYLPDIARLGAALATSDLGWGRAWHVPTSEPRTIRELANAAAAAAGRPEPTVVTMPGRGLLTAVVPMLRATRETAYQFEKPFVVDSSAAEKAFGLSATPWDEAIAQTVRALSSRS